MPPRTGTTRRAGTRAGSRAKSAKEAPNAINEAEVDIEIRPLSTFDESRNIVIHGPSGHGKTVFAGGASALKGSRVVFLSTEKGVVSAKRAGSTAQLIRAPRWEEAVAGVSWAEENLGLDDWLIVDSATKMQMLYLRWILRMEHDANPARDLDIPAIQNYQKFQNGFIRWTDRIIDGPFNSIIITTSMSVEDAEGEPRVIPQIRGTSKNPGEISDYISAQADVVLYFAVARKRDSEGNPIRRALAQPFPPYLAKDRYNALGRYQDVAEGDYFAMADFIEMINDALKEGSDAATAEVS